MSPAVTAPTRPLLRVEDLRVTIPTGRGSVRAVDGVSFELGHGELLGVLGESGCGKSAMARALLGLGVGRGTLIEGRIWVDGTELTGLRERDRRRFRGARMGMIFQDALAALNPVTTVGHQIAEAVRLDGASREEARDRVVALLDDVGIPDAARRARQYPHEFSGGMRQRAMIAMSLARDPDIIVADEPTTALDVTVQAQILELLERYRSEREMGVLLITHDIGVVARNADRVLVMYAGRLAETGPTAEVLANPKHPYTRGLIDSAPSYGRRVERLATIPGSPPDLSLPIPGCAFAPRCPLATAACAQRPSEREVAPDRWAACHRAEEVR